MFVDHIFPFGVADTKYRYLKEFQFNVLPIPQCAHSNADSAGISA